MELIDAKARAAIIALEKNFVDPYLSVYSNVTPAQYLNFQIGVYDALSEANPEFPDMYKLSNLYAFKAVASSILTAGHSSKIAFETNNPQYASDTHGDKYIEKYLTPVVMVDWLTPNLDGQERTKILSKFSGGELDPKSFIASVGLALASGQSVTSASILDARESLYGDDVTLASSSRTKIADTVGTDAIDTIHLNSESIVYIKEYSQTTHNFTFTQAQTTKQTTLVNIERVEFSDGKRLALDIEGHAGQAYRLYKAAFDRVPDKEGLGFWIGQLDKGTSIDSVAAGFIASQEFQTINGASPSNLQLVTGLYQHILGRAPDQSGLDFWKTQLDSHALDASHLLMNFAESNENKIALTGQVQYGIEYVA
ncbi:DUF4214 domain-containing protein [Pseudomonas sp. DP16D-R1]|uniref:DUF4214 domain-containing protein n=1 Tax=Pseudomonas sp. DP16D-R1 TaxID=2075551 RepID=UPI000CD05116|nr:DUF4214 domain-containing protein [Pseudomonas sp. DP16D-R1]POA77336.1 hypothetical protein C1890_15970 [Pseudomonas sp. DP16D-R1]